MQEPDLQNAIETLTKSYLDMPDSYFSEFELQYDLYRILRNSKAFDTYVIANSGEKVGMVHPEYPSVGRIQLSRGKGYRVWFDLAVLNPEFIRNNPYPTVLARDERKSKLWGENLFAAVEFKFFPKNRPTNIKSVITDCEKLNLCPEIQHRYVLAFSRYNPDISEFKDIDFQKTKLLWITKTGVNKFY